MSIQQKNDKKYQIILPTSGTGKREISNLLKRRKPQLLKAIKKLETDPTNYRIKGIEKLSDNRLGQYTIRVSKGDRLFYDVDMKNNKVFLLRAGKHDLYKLLK
ncbi:MAG: hypothetical protein AAB874_02265 [Patescibacteria group bacterium]